jgi:hypothetical protein
MTDVQDIFNKFYADYTKTHKPCPIQEKAAYDIINCRTSVMGGHVDECELCGYTGISYNSCRNRNCPLCQTIRKEKWIDARKSELLDAPYFHVVLTLPNELKMLIYQNQELLFSLMYKAASGTLLELAGSNEYLDAQIGFTSVLHTWGQGLVFHPHIHTIVLAGGLTKENSWRCSSKKFFIPVKVLGKKFRGKFLDYLKKYYTENQLKFYGMLKELENPESFQALIDICYNKSWYTYSKRPFSGPEAVIKYLAKYTHRVAISNSRIVSMGDETVTIKVRDYKDKSKEKLLSLSGVEFIRRFLMHILPRGFVKLRHFGILGNRNKKTKLELCRKLTRSKLYKPIYTNLSTLEILKLITGKDISKCPACNCGKMQKTYGWNKMGQSSC